MLVSVHYLFNECSFNDKCDQRKPLKCITAVYVFVYAYGAYLAYFALSVKLFMNVNAHSTNDTHIRFSGSLVCANIGMVMPLIPFRL